MCYASKFYTFSDVSMGPPPQTCVEGIQKVMDKAARITKWSGIVFFIFTLIGFILTMTLVFRKKGDNEEPLLSVN
jgi:hypothetical protein